MELSNRVSSSISLPFITADMTGPKHMDVTLTRSQYEAVVDPVLRRLDDPRHDVEGPDFFRAGLVAIHVESDAHREEGLVGGPLAFGKLAIGKFGEPAGQQLGTGSRTELFVEQLVMKALGLVGLEFHGRHACHRLSRDGILGGTTSGRRPPS